MSEGEGWGTRGDGGKREGKMRGKKEERKEKEKKKCRKEYADDLFAYIVTVMTP